jgi:hypothetical protein
MDHSVASVRRYVEVELTRGPAGVHAGMIVHPTRREVFIAVPGEDKIIKVGADSGSFARTAREEYPIYSNQLPSFEYSIWECVDFQDFAAGIATPSGMALSPDLERLFVAERSTGRILAFEVSTGAFLYAIDTGFTSIGGMDFGPESGNLYFVDANTNTLNELVAEVDCAVPYASRVDPAFTNDVDAAAATLGFDETSAFLDLLMSSNQNCSADPTIPDSAFFDQVRPFLSVCPISYSSYQSHIISCWFSRYLLVLRFVYTGA